MTTYIIKLIGEDSAAGLFARLIVLVLVQILVWLLILSGGWLLGYPLDVRILTIVLVTCTFAFVFGQVASELPRDNEFALARLAVSTGFRTGLPLITVLIFEQIIEPGFLKSSIGFLMAFYLIGLITSIGISVYHFGHRNRTIHTKHKNDKQPDNSANPLQMGVCTGWTVEINCSDKLTHQKRGCTSDFSG